MPPVLSLSWRSFALEKDGHDVSEYEDAFAAAPDAGRFAVADGASESSYAGEWARLLVEAFVADPVRRDGWADWLAPVREAWLKTIGQGELTWYAAQKREDGAYATFVGLEIDSAFRETGFPWRAAAVGDACLFQIRGDALLLSFPVEHSNEFGTRPELVNSAPKGRIPSQDHFLAGRARPGDSFVLATDALANWFLAEVESGGRPWEVIAGLTPEAFPVWVEHLRSERALRNDDVTLVTIEIGVSDADP
jgi:hypothetical protein